MRRAVMVVCAAALAGCGGNAGPGGMTPRGGDKLYIVNQSGASISVVDQQRLVVDTTLDLQQMGFSANAKPHHVAVEPDGSYWYVSLIADGRVLKLDRQNRLIAQVRLETPGLLELDPHRDTLYAGRSMTAPNPPKTLGVIKRSDFTLVDEQEVQIPRPHALVASRDGRWVHTASLAENTVASIEVATDHVVLTHLPGQFRSLVQFAVSPDGHWIVAGGELSNSVLIFDASGPEPLKLVRETPVPARDAKVSSKPWDPVFSPDGKYVYFSLFGDNSVVEIDLASGTVHRTFTGDFAQPYDMIMRHDGKYLFVVNQNTGATPAAGQSAHGGMAMSDAASRNGWLSVVDIASGQVVKQLMLGPGPTGMGAAGAR